MGSSLEPSYDLGDVFWAKVGSHPWWPCMIYHTPDGSPFEKVTQRGISYHVQFLGPIIERAWVHVTNLIPFEGKSKFDEYVSVKLNGVTDKSEKAKYDAKSTSCSRESWTESWKEAEVALKLSREKRLKRFGRLRVSKKLRQISHLEEGQLLKLLSNVPLTMAEEAEALAHYLQQEVDLRHNGSPDFDKRLETELKAQWPSFDIATKRSYLPNKLGAFQLQADRPRRTSKVTPEENNKASDESNKKSTKRSSKPTKASQDPLEFDVEIHRLIVSPAQYRYQPVCPVCEVYSVTPGQMFKCQGPCGRLMHPSCMRYRSAPPADNNRPEKFRCPECLTGDFLCALCLKPADKSLKGTLHQCEAKNCGRFFHQTCIIGQPGVLAQSSETEGFHILRCPAHCCQACVLEQRDATESASSVPGDTVLLQCVRCPSAFHIGDLCTPAGSVEVSLSHIVCPRHFEEELNQLPAFKTQHPSWCFKCFNSMTEKVSCGTCPAVYHPSCLAQPVSGDFRCPACRNGVFPRYAQIVWAKIAHFRWWPCEIIHARNAPINILNMSHPEGTFPVHFLGSDEYQWVCRGSVLPYELGLKSSAAKDSRGTKSVERAFTRALHHAPKTHQLYVNHVLKRGLPLTSMVADPLPEEELLSSTSIDVDFVRPLSDEEHKTLAMCDVEKIDNVVYSDNLWINVQKAMQSRKPTQPCLCSNETRGSSGHCSQKTKCSNALNHIECTQQICSFSTKDCGNRRLLKLHSIPEDDRVVVFRTVNRGYGLMANVPFKKDEFVSDYVGELITVEEANRRIVNALGPSALANMTSQRKGFKPDAETFMIRFSADWDFVLDARSKGNYSRFINHSCEPNLRAENWLVDGKPHLVLVANRLIDSREELTLDYLSCGILATGLMGATCLCLCGSDSCVNTLKMPVAYKTSSLTSDELDDIQSLVASDRRKSRQKTANTDVPASEAKVGAKEESAFSVVSLLAAAKSNTIPRASRSLLQPKTMLAHSNESDSYRQENESERYIPPGLQPPPHEDFCYRCGDGGELLLCDKTTCSKAFHLHCLGLSCPPCGIWYCPWHYCDVCGHPSTHLCWRCPNSYCQKHADESVIRVDELDEERWNATKNQLTDATTLAVISSFRWICSDHVGVVIKGPEHRPQLLVSEKSSKLNGKAATTDNSPDKSSIDGQSFNATNEKRRLSKPSSKYPGARRKSKTLGSNVNRLSLLKYSTKSDARKRPAATPPAMTNKRLRFA